MIIEAIISSMHGESLRKGDLFRMTNEFTPQGNGFPKFKARLVGNHATEISDKIKKLSEGQGRDVMDGSNLYFKVETNYPQEFYQALSKFGFSLVDSKIYHEGEKNDN